MKNVDNAMEVAIQCQVPVMETNEQQTFHSYTLKIC
jgi:hypothetical protein